MLLLVLTNVFLAGVATWAISGRRAAEQTAAEACRQRDGALAACDRLGKRLRTNPRFAVGNRPAHARPRFDAPPAALEAQQLRVAPGTFRVPIRQAS